MTSLVALERFERAEPLANESYERRQRVYGPTHKKTGEALDLLAHLYEAWNKPETAAEYRTLFPVDEPSAAGPGEPEPGQQTDRG